MITEKMTIHKGLAELKSLDVRIKKEISDANFCTAAKKSSSKIRGKSSEEFKKDAENTLNRINELIRRRDSIKRAISRSNAITIVTIGGKEYTVAEAIYMNQSGMDMKRELLAKMKSLYSHSVTIVESKNESLEDRANSFIFGLTKDKNANMSSNDINSAREAYIKENEYDLIDGIDISNCIRVLSDEIYSFTTEVDSALSVSNANTVIEISY